MKIFPWQINLYLGWPCFSGFLGLFDLKKGPYNSCDTEVPKKLLPWLNVGAGNLAGNHA